MSVDLPYVIVYKPHGRSKRARTAEELAAFLATGWSAIKPDDAPVDIVSPEDPSPAPRAARSRSKAKE